MVVLSWDDADQADLDEEVRKKEEAELSKMHKQMQLRTLQVDGLAKQVEAAEEERIRLPSDAVIPRWRSRVHGQYTLD